MESIFQKSSGFDDIIKSNQKKEIDNKDNMDILIFSL